MSFGHERDIESFEVVEGVTKKVLATGDKMQFSVVFIEKGSTIPDHSHSNEQGGYMLKGKFEVEMGGEKGVLEQGSYYLLPAGTSHSGFFPEDTIMIEVHCPPKRPEEMVVPR